MVPAGRAVLQFPAHERARDQRACRVLDMVLIHSFARSFIHPECELSVRRVPGQGTEPDSMGDPAFGGWGKRGKTGVRQKWHRLLPIHTCPPSQGQVLI